MPDIQLTTPDEIEDLLVDLIRRRHPEHLAKRERLRDLPPETYERLATVSYMADEDAGRLSNQTLPAVRLSCSGAAGQAQRTEDDTLDVPLQCVVEVTVMGNANRDTLRKRDVIAWTVAETVLQRTPRSIVRSVDLIDFEALDATKDNQLVGEYRFIFGLTIASMVAIAGGLPPDDTRWPAGGPGGPPASPYEPPADFPPPTIRSVQLDQAPIVE